MREGQNGCVSTMSQELLPNFSRSRYVSLWDDQFAEIELAASTQIQRIRGCSVVSTSVIHFYVHLARSGSRDQTSCSISATLGLFFRRTPTKAAIISILSVTYQQAILFVKVGKHTHCWTISTSSWLTPTRRIPRRCHPVSRFKFWIIIPESTTISVSISSRICRSDRYRP